MLKTVIMTWEWQELPVDIWVEKEKIAARIIEKNRIDDWYGAIYDSLCLTADDLNRDTILISDYLEEDQDNTEELLDYIEIKPSWRVELPRNREVQALNRPMALGTAWDVLIIVAR